MIGSKTKVGKIVESENLGFSSSKKSHAAFSANALLAATMLDLLKLFPWGLGALSTYLS